jgi:Flp pilus assembly pilin Flp
MRIQITKLWQDYGGQDIVEYSLLISFITLASAAVYFLGVGTVMPAIWQKAGNALNTASGGS